MMMVDEAHFFKNCFVFTKLRNVAGITTVSYTHLLYRRTYGQVTKAFQSLPIFNCQIPYTVKVGDANSYGMSVMELEQRCV